MQQKYDKILTHFVEGLEFNTGIKLMIYEDRNYLIFEVSELELVDFSQVLETSADTVRKSIDQTKTFVKWEGSTPSFVSSMQTAEGPYSYEEITSILSTTAWTEPNPGWRCAAG